MQDLPDILNTCRNYNGVIGKIGMCHLSLGAGREKRPADLVFGSSELAVGGPEIEWQKCDLSRSELMIPPVPIRLFGAHRDDFMLHIQILIEL